MATISPMPESTVKDAEEAIIEVRTLSGATSLASDGESDEGALSVSPSFRDDDRGRSGKDAKLRKLYRKVDWRLLSWYGLVFMLVKLSTKSARPLHFDRMCRPRLISLILHRHHERCNHES